MDLVTGAMASLGPKLLQLLQDEYKLQIGVRKQVEFLSVELESIHAALRKVADVPPDKLDEQVRIWAREVREASYDMEDILDTFLVRVEGREPADPSRLKSVMSKMGSLFNKVKARRDIASGIEDIKKQLQEVAERHSRYRVDEILTKAVPTTTEIDPRLAAMYKDVRHLIGIDKSTRDVMSIVASQVHDVSDKKTVKMVSILGVGGLGKTTLADRSYKQLKSEYDCGAFVSVGRNPDMVKVFKDILFDLDKYKCENIHNSGRGADLLIREIREFIENKRYFIVIDDIWEPVSWEIVKLALVENDCGSGEITTTRIFYVAMEAGEVYKLQPLSYNDSKKLFYSRIFSGDGNCPNSHPGELLDKIMKKCGGVPLAIITMASLLAGKPLEEWSETLDVKGTGIKELPESTVLLTQLLRLSCRTRGLDGIGKLSSLEDLRIHHCNDGRSNVMRFVKELGSLRELRVLKATINVMDQTMLSDLVESLRNLHKFRHLELSLEHAIDTDGVMWEEAGFELPQNLRHLSLPNIRFPRLPSSCINPSRLHILSYLTLNVRTMDQEDLKLLGRLTELRCLRLSTESCPH